MSRTWLGMVAALVLVGAAGGAVAGQEAEEASPGSMPTMAPMPTMESMPSMGPGLLVHDVWTRESPMIDLAGAVFMTLDNTTTEDDTLIGASSPAATIVELHQSAMSADGQMTMTPVEAVPVPAGGTAVLEPGGYHIMLIDLVEPLVAGASIEVTLSFEHASPQTVRALVMPVGPMMETASPASPASDAS